MQTMWFGKNLEDAIEDKRIHHQLYPEYVSYEKGFDMVNSIVTYARCQSAGYGKEGLFMICMSNVMMTKGVRGSL